MNLYQNDFCILTEKLTETHPNIYHAVGEAQIELEKERIKSLLTDVEDDFQAKILYQQFVRNIKDGHTSLLYFYGIKEDRFGIIIEKTGNDFYIKNIHTDYPEELIGQKIIQIADLPAMDVYQKIAVVICSDNVYGEEKTFSNHFANCPSIYKRLGITDNECLTLLTENGTTAVIRTYANPTFYTPKKEGFTKQSDYHFDYKIKDKICYFQYNSCFDQQTADYYKDSGMFKGDILDYFDKQAKEKGGDFRDFLNRMFYDIDKEEVRHLIIDLRNNSGGNSSLNDQLLCCILEDNQEICCGRVNRKVSSLVKECRPEQFSYYMNDKDEKDLPFFFKSEQLKTNSFMFHDPESSFYFKPSFKFKGQVYLLIGKKTFSSAAMLANVMSDNKLAITIGEATSGKPSHYVDALQFTLPATGTTVQVSYSEFFRPDESKNDEEALYPDYLVLQDIKALHFKGIDTVFEKALELTLQRTQK